MDIIEKGAVRGRCGGVWGEQWGTRKSLFILVNAADNKKYNIMKNS